MPKKDEDKDGKTCDEEVDACLTRCTDEYGGTMYVGRCSSFPSRRESRP